MENVQVVSHQPLVLNFLDDYSRLLSDRAMKFSRNGAATLKAKALELVDKMNLEGLGDQLTDIVFSNKKVLDEAKGYWKFTVPDYVSKRKQIGLDAFRFLMTESGIFQELGVTVEKHKNFDDVYYIQLAD